MSEIYTVIVVILGILAVSGLFVGVSNDAVNFLNSAIGSKAAPMKTILLVASIGILLGTVTSSGMMEVARNGMFNPGLFSFHEVMMLYMGVMFANVILLDLYNSMGLPTSTTVSLIFCLLGAAVAVSIYKISNDGALGMGDLNHFINTGRAMGIVSAILLSVVIAFTFGTLIMYISRLIFSFRYTAMFRRFGAFWCGASFTAILYFAVFKGLKTPLAGSAAIEWIDQHILLSLFLCWAVGSLLLFFLQRLKINILRLTILSGTFALALAFAGNDLVNFIGVPVAGFDAYSIARHAGDSTILMEGLNASVQPFHQNRAVAGMTGDAVCVESGYRDADEVHQVVACECQSQSEGAREDRKSQNVDFQPLQEEEQQAADGPAQKEGEQDMLVDPFDRGASGERGFESFEDGEVEDRREGGSAPEGTEAAEHRRIAEREDQTGDIHD